jgi:hypothetical protein
VYVVMAVVVVMAAVVGIKHRSLSMHACMRCDIEPRDIIRRVCESEVHHMPKQAMR